MRYREIDHFKLYEVKERLISKVENIKGVEGFGFGDAWVNVYMSNDTKLWQIPQLTEGVPIRVLACKELMASKFIAREIPGVYNPYVYKKG